MNERIKELAEQAYRQDCMENNPNWKEGVAFERFMGLMDGTFEKFAELIVKDTTEYLIDMANNLYNDDRGAAVALLYEAKELKKRYGVKE